jgi:ribosomal protein L11 methyltransferase
MLVKLVVRTPRKLAEIVSGILFQAGAGAIEEQGSPLRLVVYVECRENAETILTRAREMLRQAAPGQSGIAFNIQVDETSDWASAWTQHLTQIALTPNLVIQPLWDETPAPLGSERILYDPRLSFGDGAHATTRLASVAIERQCRARPGISVLDFGSGTGVLSFVALLSGAAWAWGVDVDPVSIEAAGRNALLNGLTDRAQFSLPEALGARAFELVVANLEAPVLLTCGAELARRARLAERLIVTGFLCDREPEIAALFGAGFDIEHAEREADWALLELVPRR